MSPRYCKMYENKNLTLKLRRDRSSQSYLTISKKFIHLTESFTTNIHAQNMYASPHMYKHTFKYMIMLTSASWRSFIGLSETIIIQASSEYSKRF